MVIVEWHGTIRMNREAGHVVQWVKRTCFASMKASVQIPITHVIKQNKKLGMKKFMWNLKYLQ